MAGQATVLVIDDAEDVCVALTELLEEEGFAAKTAGDGREALDLLLGGLRPCAILLDLMMPGMNGWDFLRSLHRDPELGRTRVVVVSALGRVPELPVTGFLPKPFGLDALISLVRTVTRSHGDGAGTHV
jgi:CheY-like chemotaxis protein